MPIVGSQAQDFSGPLLWAQAGQIRLQARRASELFVQG